jgi:Phasin protein
MARSTMEFAKQNTEQAAQAANWMRAMAEQNLSQSRAAFEGFLSLTRNALRSMDQQSSAICEHSMAIAEQTLSNAFEFAHKAIRASEPQELAQIQSEFVSRQTQVLGDQAKELGQRMMQGAQEIGNAAQEGTAESRRQSEAA